MIYAITNKKSFMEISRLRDKILRIKDKNSVPMVLMGNKRLVKPAINWL